MHGLREASEMRGAPPPGGLLFSEDVVLDMARLVGCIVTRAEDLESEDQGWGPLSVISCSGDLCLSFLALKQAGQMR